MICEYADDPEMIAYAKEMGAKGINVAGVCCTSNEVAMRRRYSDGRKLPAAGERGSDRSL